MILNSVFRGLDNQLSPLCHLLIAPVLLSWQLRSYADILETEISYVLDVR